MVLRARGAVAVAVALVATLATASFAAERDKALTVGEKAPALALGDQHGKPFTLADALAANRWVVLAFYPKAFTGG